MSLNAPPNQFITSTQTQQIVAKNNVYIHISDRFSLNIALLNVKMDFMEILQQKNVRLVEHNV